MLRRCSMNKEALLLLNTLASENRSVILVLGHKGNWEWAGNSFSMQCKHQLYVIYHPLANEYYDGLMYRMRSRFGTKLIKMRETAKEMLRNRGEVNATAFIADQSPNPEKAHWMTFLNQDTPVFTGTERFARKFNMPVVYMCVQRIGRGRYTISAELLVKDPASMPDNAVTELHTRRLEEDIKMEPQTWLWTHKRWKHKR